MKINCQFYNTCNAPICPLMEPDVDKQVWYPSEDICRKRGFYIVQLQKKIRTAGLNDNIGIFPGIMLKRIKKVHCNLKGLNPEGDVDAQLKTWLRRHRKDYSLDSDNDRRRNEEMSENTGFQGPQIVNGIQIPLKETGGLKPLFSSGAASSETRSKEVE